MILLLHLWHEFVEEEVLIVPPGDIKIAALHVAHIGATCIWHHYHHLVCLARGYQLICHRLHVSLLYPCRIVVTKSVKKIHDGIHTVFLVESVGQIHIIFHPRAKDITLDGICFHKSCLRCRSVHE